MSNERRSEITRSRRDILKWGLLGALATGPLGIMAWRKWRRSQYRYEYVLEKPIRRVDDAYFPYVACGSACPWSGGGRNRMYTPKHVKLWPSGLSTEDPEVHVDVTFNVATDAPENLLALVKVALWSDGSAFAVEEGMWNAPHKQPSKESYPYVGVSAPTVSVLPPQEYLLITVPLADIEKIDKITVSIEDIIRG